MSESVTLLLYHPDLAYSQANQYEYYSYVSTQKRLILIIAPFSGEMI